MDPVLAGPPNEHEQGKIFIKFDVRAMKDERASLQEGRPIFKDVDFIHKFIPGDKTTEIHRPVREEDKHEFRQQYEAWKSGQKGDLSGTPLAEWPGVTRSQVEELAFFHIRTVEHLANVSDGNIAKLGPIQHLKQKARDYLEKAKGGALEQKLRAENDDLRARLTAMEAQMAKMNALLERATVPEEPTPKGKR